MKEPSVQETTAMAGWKLVPVEPTNDMCVAGWRKADERDAVLGNGEIAMVYRAMLAACPPPPATSSAVEALPETLKGMAFRVRALLLVDRQESWEARVAIADDLDALARQCAALQAGTEVAVKALSFERKTAINLRFMELYDAAMQAGKHGHYESMFGAMHQAYAESAAPVQQAGVDDPVTALSAQNDARTIHGAGRQAGSELVEPVAWRKRRVRGIANKGWVTSDQRFYREELDDDWEVQALVPAASLSQLQQRIAEAEEVAADADNWGLLAAKYLTRAEAAEAALAASDAKLAEAVEVITPFAEVAITYIDPPDHRIVKAKHVNGLFFGMFRRARSFTSLIQEKGNG